MIVDGWIAVSKHGYILGSFHEDQDNATEAAWRILRLLGGQQLVAGFQLEKASLIVGPEKTDDPDERQCIPISEGRRRDGTPTVPA